MRWLFHAEQLLEAPVISVIIPTCNEEGTLPATVASVRANSRPHEIIVVDAGSNDKTVAIARELGVMVEISAARQRAAQMNHGARRARGEILLFLHADTRLPKIAFERIEQCLALERIGGGAFARRFDSPSLLLKMTCLLAEMRNRAIGWHLGDQAIFVRRNLFEKLNGFAPWNRFEDLDFSRRLARIALVATLRPPVVSSARRFEKEGAARRTWRDFLLTMQYLQSAEAKV